VALKRSFALAVAVLALAGCHTVVEGSASTTAPVASITPAVTSPVASPTTAPSPSTRASASPTNTLKLDRSVFCGDVTQAKAWAENASNGVDLQADLPATDAALRLLAHDLSSDADTLARDGDAARARVASTLATDVSQLDDALTIGAMVGVSAYSVIEAAKGAACP
jgi:hypothetical protein